MKLTPCPVAWRVILCDEAVRILKQTHGEPWIFDSETDGLLVRDGQHTAKYLGLTNAAHPGHCLIVKAPFTPALLCELANSLLVGQNARFDCHALGLNLTGAAPYDTMVRIYGHNTTTLKSLDDIAPRMGYSKQPTPELIKQGRIAEMSTGEVAPYLADDCAMTAALFLQQIKYQGRASDLNVLDFDTERAVLNMERRGVRLLAEPLAALNEAIKEELADSKKELESVGVPSTLNVGSPKQVMELFTSRGVKLPLHPKTKKPTTDRMAMEKLEMQGDPIAAALVRNRGLTKLKTSFVDTLPNFVSPLTGLIHASFKTAHTKTGRLAAEEPPLHQTPKRGKLSKRFRHCFTSPSGRIAGADYDQFELRLATAESRDPRLIEVFAAGGDPHTNTAAQVLGKTLAAVTEAERQTAKTVNFSVLNGMREKRLSHLLRCSVSEARRYLDNYFARFCVLHEWMEATWRSCETGGLARTFMGRQRIFGRDEDTRPGISVVVQGGAGDLKRAALVELDRQGFQLILEIHDEILVDAAKPDGTLTRGEEVATVMRQAANDLWLKVRGDLPVQFTATPGEGATWGNC